MKQASYLRPDPKFLVPTVVNPDAACPVPVDDTGPAVPAAPAAGALAALTDCAATGPVLGAIAGAAIGAAAPLLLPAFRRNQKL